MRIILKISASGLPLLVGICTLFLFCGGSEIGNPRTTVAGAVCDTTGTRIAEVSLFLIDSSVTDPHQLQPDSCMKTTTGTDGSYRFTEVEEGSYKLYGVTPDGERMLLRSIDLSDENFVTVTDGDFVEGVDTIKSSAKVIVNLGSCLLRNGNFIFIPGTVIRVLADSCGEYLVRCPASKVDIVYSRNDSLETLDSNLNLSSGQWLDLTGKSYTIPEPAIISGTVTGIADRTYLFSVDSIYLGENHPVQYRFDWGDSVSSWLFTATAGHAWNTAGTYPVSVRARSLRDTLSLSQWSDSTMVTVQ